MEPWVTRPDWVTDEAVAAVGALLFAVSINFIVINLGLRAIPEGRTFLKAARDDGRLLAHPDRETPRPVLTIFGLALAASVMGGVLAYSLLLEAVRTISWPSPVQIAGQIAGGVR
ncbi:MAG: hypothetical protein ACFBSD_11150 [Paracoccaceae bacterium]